jgi:hypothetical protein
MCPPPRNKGITPSVLLSYVSISRCPCQWQCVGNRIGSKQVTSSPNTKYGAHTPGQWETGCGNSWSCITEWRDGASIKGSAGVCSEVDSVLFRTMEPSVLLLLALLTGFLLLLIRGQPKAYSRLPPGPRPLPFLGNLLQMDRGGLLKSFIKVRTIWGLSVGFPLLFFFFWRSLIRKSKKHLPGCRFRWEGWWGNGWDLDWWWMLTHAQTDKWVFLCWNCVGHCTWSVRGIEVLRCWGVSM